MGKSYDFRFEELLVVFCERMRLQRLSGKTQKNYLYNVKNFLAFLTKNSFNLNNDSVKSYFLSLESYDVNTVLQVKASIKYFCLANNLDVDFNFLPSPKKKKSLPKVVSKEEVKQAIKRAGNLKHKLIIILLYSSGLRVSELVNLKRKNIDFINKTVFIEQSKCCKDRYTLLSEKAESYLAEYISKEKFSSSYLFEGRKGKYSVKSVQEILKKCFTRHVTPHMLRHSFATHLLEEGVNIKYIQKLLGHSRVEATNVYLHVSKSDFLKVKSPFD